MSVGSEMCGWTASSSTVTSGSPTTARANPAARRRAERPRSPERDRVARPRWGAPSCGTRWTSRGPADAAVVVPTPGASSWARRPRLLVPSTSCVAAVACANSSNARGTSLPTTR